MGWNHQLEHVGSRPISSELSADFTDVLPQKTGGGIWNSIGLGAHIFFSNQVAKSMEYCGVSPFFVPSWYFATASELHGALIDNEDIYRVAFGLSSDLTKLLYPLQMFSGKSARALDFQK